MNISFFGSSLLSSYWNGAATYYRGLLKYLARSGHSVVFYEPDAFGRQQKRDIAPPQWARVVVYPATLDGWRAALEDGAKRADLLVKASGVGAFDRELDTAVVDARRRDAIVVYWDVDAPATLDAVATSPHHHLRREIPRFDLIFTYGGGDPVVAGYMRLGARACRPIYNAVDPDTHHPVAVDPAWRRDLGLLANRLPDRERRIEEFFFKPAALLPQRRFLLGGAGWNDRDLPSNVEALGHVGTGDHNRFFCSPAATLNVNRDSMAQYGFSPPTRVFEAAGAGACLLTDAWTGIDLFLDPGAEILVAASGEDVAAHLGGLTADRAASIGAAARRRILAQHTYAHRAREVDAILASQTREAVA